MWSSSLQIWKPSYHLLSYKTLSAIWIENNVLRNRSLKYRWGVPFDGTISLHMSLLITNFWLAIVLCIQLLLTNKLYWVVKTVYSFFYTKILESWTKENFGSYTRSAVILKQKHLIVQFKVPNQARTILYKIRINLTY